MIGAVTAASATALGLASGAPRAVAKTAHAFADLVRAQLGGAPSASTSPIAADPKQELLAAARSLARLVKEKLGDARLSEAHPVSISVSPGGDVEFAGDSEIADEVRQLLAGDDQLRQSLAQVVSACRALKDGGAAPPHFGGGYPPAFGAVRISLAGGEPLITTA